MKKVRQLLIGLIIAIGTLYYTLQNVSYKELETSLINAELIYILPGLVLIVLSYVTRAYRWQILLRPFKKIPVKEIYSPLMIGFMGTFFLQGRESFCALIWSGKKMILLSQGLFPPS